MSEKPSFHKYFSRSCSIIFLPANFHHICSRDQCFSRIIPLSADKTSRYLTDFQSKTPSEIQNPADFKKKSPKPCGLLIFSPKPCSQYHFESTTLATFCLSVCISISISGVSVYSHHYLLLTALTSQGFWRRRKKIPKPPTPEAGFKTKFSKVRHQRAVLTLKRGQFKA